jgi:hypothetical protein
MNADMKHASRGLEGARRATKLADACTAVGSLGALLRTEGLYASNLTTGAANARVVCSRP